MGAGNHLANRNIRDFLLKQEHVGPLEGLLASEIKKLTALQNMAKSELLDFGGYVPRRELKGLLMEVKEEVDKLLDTEGSDTPHIRRYSPFFPGFENAIWVGLSTFAASQAVITWYDPTWSNIIPLVFMTITSGICNSAVAGSHHNPLTNVIVTQNKKLAGLISIIGHEYAHHRQGRAILVRRNTMLREGHARGVERYIANLYAEKTGNPAFLFETTQGTVAELCNAYRWMGKRLDTGVKEGLLQQGGELVRNNILQSLMARSASPTTHSVGNALFYLLETSNGRGIYKEALAENFPLPKIV